MTTSNPLSKVGCIRDGHTPTWIWTDRTEIFQSKAPCQHSHAVPALPNCAKIIQLLNAAADCELECAAIYMRQRTAADEKGDWARSVRFLGYAGEKIARSKRLGLRIVLLGGTREFAQKLHVDRYLPAGEIVRPLHSMIAANIASESKVIDGYGRILMHGNDLDLLTRIVVEDLLFEAFEQIEELRAWLETSSRGTWVSASTGST